MPYVDYAPLAQLGCKGGVAGDSAVEVANDCIEIWLGEFNVAEDGGEEGFISLGYGY